MARPQAWEGVIGLVEDIAPAIGHAMFAIEARNGRMAALRASLLREPASRVARSPAVVITTDRVPG